MSASHDHIITGHHEIKCLHNEEKVFSMVPTGISTLEPISSGSLGHLLISYGGGAAVDTGKAMTYTLFRLGHVFHLLVSGWSSYTRLDADADCAMNTSVALPAAYRPDADVTSAIIITRSDTDLVPTTLIQPDICHAILAPTGIISFRELRFAAGTAAAETSWDFSDVTGGITANPFVISYVL